MQHKCGELGNIGANWLELTQGQRLGNKVLEFLLISI
jgi:hypothetical protein